MLRACVSVVTCALVSFCPFTLGHKGHPAVAAFNLVATENPLNEPVIPMREVIVGDGGFRGLEIGLPKAHTMKRLKELGVSQLEIEPSDLLVVTESDELQKLKSFSHLKVGGGAAVLDFEGDRLVSFYVGRIFPGWRKRFEKAKNKDQVFDVLEHILLTADEEYRSVQNFDPDSGWVPLDNISAPDERRLKKLDVWRGSFRGSFNDLEGIWHLTLTFSESFISRIVVLFVPEELL